MRFGRGQPAVIVDLSVGNRSQLHGVLLVGLVRSDTSNTRYPPYGDKEETQADQAKGR